MAATDYVFQIGCFDTVYLAKKNKSKTLMSKDRRPLSENECIDIFESYLRNWVDKNEEKTLVITAGDKVVFEATLVDKSIEEYKKEVHKDDAPKNSFFETIYRCGTEPMWKVGDVLAEYEFYSDREGEIVHGEVEKVEHDEENGDWMYTFKGGAVIYEEELISNQAYKK